jgi:hypothetical protein
MFKKHTGVNFINIFTYEFFVRMSFRQLFLVTFWLWQKNSYEKCARKMLMKLTPGRLSYGFKIRTDKNKNHKCKFEVAM